MTSRAVHLRGADHPTLGEVAVRAIDGSAAAGISAGRHAKPYWHLDPNEDAALVVAADGWVLLAVADGHNGADTSHAAIAAVAEVAEAAGPVAATSVLEVAAHAAEHAVGEAIRTAGEGRDLSRTALTIAVVGDGRVHTLTWGDTSVLLVRPGRRARAKELTRATPFLGPEVLRPAAGSTAVRAGDRVVLCSDGVSGYLGRRWTDAVAEAALASPRAEDVVADLLERAASGGAGDHMAVAVTIAG